MKRIYMDYAASTPVDRRVLAEMAPYFSEKFGNPGSLHFYGQEAEAAIFAARQKIARALACSPEEIIFTGTASEANNLAIRGVIRAIDKKSNIKNQKIIISSIEHESIMETAADLEKEGVEVARIPVSKEGVVDLEKLKAALDERTVLVSVMYANNEVGTMQPIREIAKIVKDFRDSKNPSPPNGGTPFNKGRIADLRFRAFDFPLFHTDAAQAFQYLPCRSAELGVDLMTLSAHKIYGPKGIGLLYSIFGSRTSEILAPIITGGEQEGGARAGTENVPYIVGFGAAVALAEKMREREAGRVLALRNYFYKTLEVAYPKFEINGSRENRLPNNLNVYFGKHQGEIASRGPRNDEGGGLAVTKFMTAQEMLVALDINGIAASSGSACRAHTTEPSKVIMALGYSRERALSSLRFTLGRQTRKTDIDKAIKILAVAAKK